MLAKGSDSFVLEDVRNPDGVIEGRRQEARCSKPAHLQNAILTSANFSIIATDGKAHHLDHINVAAERHAGLSGRLRWSTARNKSQRHP